MAGGHSHGNHDHGHAHGSSGNLRTAFLLNLAFTIIEVIGGLYTNSIAILSDAVHDLGDPMSLGLVTP
jgi:cobalt-zinc-cadmium efflux system protein